MRENSGWDNWKMDIIAFHECDNLLGAKIQEQKYYEEYKATLNSIEPLPKPKPKIVKEVVKKERCIFYCNKCNIHFDSIKTQDVHNTTRKHIKNSAIDNGEIKNTNIPAKFLCKPCNYICSKKSDYNKHINTIKHNTINTTKIQHKNSCNCDCGKVYNHRASLYNHKKNCNGIEKKKEVNHEPNEKNTTGVETDKELLIKMLLKNQEIMEKLIEIMPNIGNNSHELSSK
jgi:hypothetical protein